MPIHLFKPVFHVEECLREIRECLEKGWTGLGFKTVEFEEKWKEYTGFGHACFLNSATAGLHLAVKILKLENGWRDGDEIVSTPMTFVSTNHAILYENLRPVFADIDQHLCMDPESLERRIGPSTRAVIFVGFGGGTGQYPRIAEICRERGLKLILDAAHMGGTRLDGRVPGKEADAVVYSFHSVKNLPTADGGMLCFRDGRHDEICRKMSWLGINKDTYSRAQGAGAYKWKYDVEYVGHKCHGNSVMAAIALVQLKYLDRDNAYRRQIAEWYGANLLGQDSVQPVPVPPGCESSRHLYVVEVDRRDEVLLALNEAGVYPGVHYRDNTEYPMYAYAQDDCPNSRRTGGRVLSLPMHLELSRKDVDYVSEHLLKYCCPKR